MILHLSAAGVPVSWTVVAAYRSAYGIAHAAAEGWYRLERTTPGERPSDDPQYVCELVGDDERGWTLRRDELWMGEHHLSRQSHDATAWLVQAHTAPFAMSDALADAVAAALRARLTRFGYLIERAAWERRYPSQVMISRRFAEFNAAFDAWRTEHPDRDDRMPFEPRWTMFMEAPEGHRPPYGIEDGVILERSDETMVPFAPAVLAHLEGEDRVAAARLLNSGWDADQVAVLLTPEPVEG